MGVMSDGGIRDLFIYFFCKENFPFNSLHGARFLLLVPNSSRAKAHIPYEMIVPILFEEPPSFHAMALMNGRIGRKKLNIVRDCLNATQAGTGYSLLRRLRICP